VTGSTAVATLTSGESQALFIGATEVADFDAAGGDLVMVAAGSNYPVFSLYVNKSVPSIQGLAGRKIAVTRTGTSTDTAARLTFRKSYLARNRETALKVLRAYLAAWAYIRTPANEAGTEASIARYTRSTSEQAAVAYRAFFPVWQDKIPRVDPRGVRNAIRFG